MYKDKNVIFEAYLVQPRDIINIYIYIYISYIYLCCLSVCLSVCLFVCLYVTILKNPYKTKTNKARMLIFSVKVTYHGRRLP